MPALAPKICPVCDLTYDETLLSEDMPRISYFHFGLHRLCVKTDGQHGITLRLVDDGYAMSRHCGE